jgi:zinc transporter ZupT
MRLLAVFAAALATALATGLGALPFLWRRDARRAWLGVANAVAAGVMLGAGIGLLVEGSGRSGWRAGAGALAGMFFVWLGHRLTPHGDELHFATLRGVDARKGLLIVVVMTVHSVAEGVGVGSSFGDGNRLGLLITIAIALHNIPEGLAISLVLVPRGASVWSAAGWSVFSSLPQPLMAVPAFIFVSALSGVLPFGLGFAAGAMIWLVVSDLLPEALAQERPVAVLGVASASLALMLGAQLALL